MVFSPLTEEEILQWFKDSIRMYSYSFELSQYPENIIFL